jgi:hypothetical protein
MKVWLTTVFILFALVQTFQWAKGVMLPLPLYLLAGAFLAIASNYEKGLGTLLNTPKPSSSSINPLTQTATLMDNPQLIQGKDP